MSVYVPGNVCVCMTVKVLLSGKTPGPVKPVRIAICSRAMLTWEGDSTKGRYFNSSENLFCRQEHACCRGLEQVLERCLGEMERRLMEHMDQRLDAMQLRLETALLQTLALPLNHLKTTAPTPDQPQALH